MTRFVVAMAVVCAACGSGAATEESGSAASTDTSSTSTSGSAADDSSGSSGSGTRCEFPPPRLGDSAAAQALASGPAACGQAEYTWLSDEDSGRVTAVGEPRTYAASDLVGLAGLAGLVLPTAPEHEVVLVPFAYRTQARGIVVESSAVLAVPSDLAPGAELDVLLLLHGTSGFTSGCGPTADPFWQGVAAVLAGTGFAVVAPDLLGLEGFGQGSDLAHPYIVAEPTVMAALDAVRAAGGLEPEARADTCLRPQYVALGNSQGGHAVLWIDRIGPYYAAELELRGGAALVPAIDLSAEAADILQSPLSDRSVLGSALFDAHARWYGYEDRLPEIFRPPHDTNVREALLASCAPTSGEVFGDATTIQDVFTEDFTADVVSGEVDSPWTCALRATDLVTTEIPRPDHSGSHALFISIGGEDELLAPSIERAAVTELCAAGMPIEAVECDGLGHDDTTLATFGPALEFLIGRLAEAPFESDCSPPSVQSCVP